MSELFKRRARGPFGDDRRYTIGSALPTLGALKSLAVIRAGGASPLGKFTAIDDVGEAFVVAGVAEPAWLSDLAGVNTRGTGRGFDAARSMLFGAFC